VITVRGRKPAPAPEPAPCGCAERLAELETAVAALARYAARSGGAEDVYLVPGNRVVNVRADAAVIRKAAAVRAAITSQG
jgi:hypothetical protein